MKDKMRKYLCIIIIICIPIQLYLNDKLNKKINEKPVSIEVHEEVRAKDLSQLKKELSILNNCIILNAYNDNDRWCIKLKLYGDKQDILNEMNKLEAYDIKNYIISKNNTKYYVIMDIYSNYLIK
ncbi:MAG: hypothetical protein ACI398_03030 [Clostridium sp.]